MKELKFNKNSWHSVLWVSTWGKYLPDNICGYFWSLIGAILLSPLAIAGHIMNAFRQGVVAAWWSLYPIVCFLLGCIMEIRDKQPFNYLHHSWLRIFGQGFLLSLAIVAIVATIIAFCIWKDNYDSKKMYENPKPKKTKIKREKQPNPLIEGFKAFKGKYCSRITWE